MSILANLVEKDFGISGRGRWLRSRIHSSLVVDAERDLFYFNAREIYGGPLDYLIKVRGMKKTSAKEFLNGVADTYSFDEKRNQTPYDKLVGVFNRNGKSNRTYWYKRCLTDETIDRYELGYYDGWYLIPLYLDGKFVNFQCRRDEPERRISLWYKNSGYIPILYNSEILKFVSSVYIVEGIVDCILMNQNGFPSVCSSGGSVYWGHGWMAKFCNVKNIYYIADNDPAGIAGAKRVAKNLGTDRVKVLRYKERREKYDIVNFFQEGGTPEQLKEDILSRSVWGFQTGDL